MKCEEEVNLGLGLNGIHVCFYIRFSLAVPNDQPTLVLSLSSLFGLLNALFLHPPSITIILLHEWAQN